MRSIKVWSVATVMIAAVVLANGAVRENPLAITRTPSQVEVTNFPAVQAVSGTVSVGNLPAVQTVGGTVAVSNLPMDVNGNLRVTLTTLHVVGVTQATYEYGGSIIGWSRACSAEFPGTRVCDQIEVIRSIPPPPPFPSGGVLVTYRAAGGSSIDLVANGCLKDNGYLDCNGLPPTIPIACCGF